MNSSSNGGIARKGNDHNSQRIDQVLLTRKEAAAYLGVTTQTLAIWKCTGRYSLPVVKIGRLAKYRKSDLDAFIQSRTVTM